MTARIDIVGLGPGDAGHTTPATRDLIDSIESRFVRTKWHPSAWLVDGADSFDHLYEAATTFAEVYESIAERLLEAAKRSGKILYAVPGSPLVMERTVELLRSQPDVDVVVHPAISFLDSAWARLGVDPVDSGVRLIDGHRFNETVSNPDGPLLVAQCHNQRVLSDIKLSVEEPGDAPVVVLQRLGTSEELVFEVDWWNLDREVEADHLTSIYIPIPGRSAGVSLGRLADLVARLRRECPWDSSQSHATLRRHLIEETHEVIEVIDAIEAAEGHGSDELDESLCEELGDLLFQPLLHAMIAAEDGRFGVADIADGIHDKLVARHPHVFGDAGSGPAAADLVATWEAAKRVEKDRESVFDGIAPGLPALALAAKVLRKAATLGVDTSSPNATVLVEAPGRASSDSTWLGTAVLALVAAAIEAGFDAEDAVRQAATGLRHRIRDAEVGGKDLSGLDIFGD